MKPTLAFALLCTSLPCWAQTAPATPVAKAPAVVSPAVLQPAPAREPGEPNVRYSVIEDNGSKIDELRVRGQLQHVVVTPKVGTTKSYEIVISRSGRDPVDGTGGANSAAGKRVWNVLNF